MTDHYREELIEEAAKAIQAAHMPTTGATPPWEREQEVWRETYRDFARAAFAVFEKAHDPTVIERHDLVMPIYDEPEPQSGHFHIWSDMPCKPGECRMEPRGEPMRTYFDGLDQGQSPSEALKKALAERCACGHVEHDYNGGECYESGCKCRAWKVQGEPSDAQVEAAKGQLTGDNTDRQVRAALRAAYEVRGEGR